MSDTFPFAEVKAHLSEPADRVERQHDRILVTRNGRPSFVLLSSDDLESLEETVDILEDDDLMEPLRRSRKDAEQGKRVRLAATLIAFNHTTVRAPRAKHCETTRNGERC